MLYHEEGLVPFLSTIWKYISLAVNCSAWFVGDLLVFGHSDNPGLWKPLSVGIMEIEAAGRN